MMTMEIKPSFKRTDGSYHKPPLHSGKRQLHFLRNPATSGPAGAMAGSLTDLFDIGIKREALLSGGIPTPINLTLIILALTVSLVGGFTTPHLKVRNG